jgi:hypothetical protein
MRRLKQIARYLNVLRRRIQKAVARWWDVAVAVS